ncbi:YHYH protein [bacterium]|nr:YHYH protein [bacterium]MBP9807120.1 YHYH protein [bacterium]
MLLTVGCLPNGAAAQQPELGNPQNDKPWETQIPPFHAEIGRSEGAGIGKNYHGSPNSVLRYQNRYRQLTNPIPTKDGMPPRADNQETPWEQLERALAAATPEQRANVTFKTTKLFRYIGFNNLPDFSFDILPLIANPGAAKSQAYTVRMTLSPEFRDSPAGRLRISKIPFGIALNGVLINRGENDYWKIHNHSISPDILRKLRQNKQPTLIGYAADGYPIYGPYGYMQADNPKSALVELKTSFRMKESTTTENKDFNGGHSEGTSNNSVTTSSALSSCSETNTTKPLLKYEYIDKLGDLDDYNGRFGVTPEHPQGTYHYVISNSFPYIPISFRGVPEKTFLPPGIELPTPAAPYHKLFNPSRPMMDF